MQPEEEEDTISTVELESPMTAEQAQSSMHGPAITLWLQAAAESAADSSAVPAPSPSPPLLTPNDRPPPVVELGALAELTELGSIATDSARLVTRTEQLLWLVDHLLRCGRLSSSVADALELLVYRKDPTVTGHGVY